MVRIVGEPGDRRRRCIHHRLPEALDDRIRMVEQGAAGLRAVAQRLVARRVERLVQRVERQAQQIRELIRRHIVRRGHVGDHHQPLIIAQPGLARVVEQAPGEPEQ